MLSHPSLPNRIIRAKKPVPSVNPVSHGFRGNYRAWENVSMESAVKEVEMGKSIRQAAEMYGVPRSTLYDRITGKSDFGAKPGPDPYLKFEEEKELASFLILSSKIGYPHTKTQRVRAKIILLYQMDGGKGSAIGIQTWL